MALDSDPQIDWRSRADGEEHTLHLGEHYTRPVELVRHAAIMWASRNQMRALSELGPDSITVKFVPNVGKV